MLSLATLMIRILLGQFPAFADEAQSVPKSNVRTVHYAQIKGESLNGGLSRYRTAKCTDVTELGGGEASKARPEIPRSSTKVARLDGRKAVSLETEIRVSPDGSSDLEVIDTGSPR